MTKDIQTNAQASHKIVEGSTQKKENLINNKEIEKVKIKRNESDWMHANNLNFDQFNLLVIGCGGIGCELLKLFLLSRLKFFTIVDMDNIELTNLNRQFFFQKKDIGKNKAIVTKKFYQNIIRESRITVYDKNITFKQFDVEFFGRYDLMLNCLDNIEARAFVNLRCKLAGVSIVDGGSGGYHGQSMVFLHNQMDSVLPHVEQRGFKSNTQSDCGTYLNVKNIIKGSIQRHKLECYSCFPKTQAKNIPICTIRGIPINFTHCLLFAKEMILNELCETRWFGSRRRIAKFLSRNWDKKNGNEKPTTGQADFGQISDFDRMGQSEFPHKKSQKRRSSVKSIRDDKRIYKDSENVIKKKKIGILTTEKAKKTHETDKKIHLSQKIDHITKKIKKYYKLLKQANFPVFDKENITMVKFIYYVGCFRAWQFNIEILPFIEGEKTISRIIPAICTTNAIVAGLMFSTMRKILHNRNLVKYHLDDSVNVTQGNENLDSDNGLSNVRKHSSGFVHRNMKSDKNVEQNDNYQETGQFLYSPGHSDSFYHNLTHPMNYFLTKAKKLISRQYQAAAVSDCSVCASKWFILNLVGQTVNKNAILKELDLLNGEFFIDDQLQDKDIFEIEHNTVLIVVDQMVVFRCYVQCNRGYFEIIDV